MKGTLLLILTFTFLLFPFAFASAHDGRPHKPGDLIYTWGLDPLVIVCLALSGWLYWRGVRRLWRAAERGRGVRRWEAWCFAGGWAALFVALVSPLHPLGEVLFSAHMTQHELLMLVAAPLVVLGRPVVALLWALPTSGARAVGGWGRAVWFQRVWRVLTNPLAAWALHAAALWVWHVPALFEATLCSDLVHTFQHVCFLGSALLFWWALVHGPQGLMGYGAAVLYLFTTSVHSGVLGALLTFAGGVLYPAYDATTAEWGLTALEDQQLGGLIMWVPAGLVYIVAGLALCAGWMRESERRVLRREAALKSSSLLIFAFCLLPLAFLACGARTRGPLAYVTNERDGTITVVDTATDEVVETIGVGARPRGVRLSPDGRRVYVALSTPAGKPYDAAENKVAAVDVSSGEVVARYEVGSDPEQLAVSLDGARLYASNEDAGTASVTDVESGRVVATLVVGIEPEGVTISPDGRWVYVTAETSNSVSVIDTRETRVVETFMVDARPRDAAFSPDGARAYVTTEIGRTVAVVDTSTHSVLHTLRLPPGANVKPMGVVVSPDGRRVYVATGRGNTVVVFDAATYEVLATIPVGQRVWGLALTPDGKKLYAANSLSNDVSVIDTATNQVVKAIKAGDGPWGIAIEGGGQEAAGSRQ